MKSTATSLHILCGVVASMPLSASSEGISSARQRRNSRDPHKAGDQDDEV